MNHHLIHAIGLTAKSFKHDFIEGWVVIFSRNCKDSGWFVDDDDVFVFVNNVKVLLCERNKVSLELELGLYLLKVTNKLYKQHETHLCSNISRATIAFLKLRHLSL